MIDVYIPIKVQSPNISEHHFKRSARVKKEKKIVNYFLCPQLNSLTYNFPLLVELIRISPRKFDEEENLRMAFKGIKDTISQLFFPEMKRGMADEYVFPNGAKAFEWKYAQEKGAPKEYAIRIRIQSVSAACQCYPLQT